MPSVLAHSLRLRRMIRRWRIVGLSQSEGRIGEFVSWVSPTVRLDRDWADDDRAFFGYTSDVQSTPAQGFGASSIFSGFREVHVHQIDFSVRDVGAGAIPGTEVHIMKPPFPYNPVLNGAGEFFPFLQTGKGDSILQLPAARVVAGHQTALAAVLIGGVLVDPALGPRYNYDFSLTSNLATMAPKTVTIHKRSDPPIIMPPRIQLTVQVINPPDFKDTILFVNWLISERETA